MVMAMARAVVRADCCDDMYCRFYRYSIVAMLVGILYEDGNADDIVDQQV